MAELDEGYSRFGTIMDRIFERLLPDAVFFLSKLSPEQINNLEQEIAEENEKIMKKLENRQEHLEERKENFWDQMEDWFGDFSVSQREQITEIQTKWFIDTPDPSEVRMDRRRKSQTQFLLLLRSAPEKKQLEKWFRKWFLSWQGVSDSARKVRTLRNKKRVLQIDRVLTPEHRLHAVQELDVWLENLEQIIVNR